MKQNHTRPVLVLSIFTQADLHQLLSTTLHEVTCLICFLEPAPSGDQWNYSFWDLTLSCVAKVDCLTALQLCVFSLCHTYIRLQVQLIHRGVISSRKWFKALKLAVEEEEGMGLISHSASESEHSGVFGITGALGHPAESYVHCWPRRSAKGGDGEIWCVWVWGWAYGEKIQKETFCRGKWEPDFGKTSAAVRASLSPGLTPSTCLLTSHQICDISSSVGYIHYINNQHILSPICIMLHVRRETRCSKLIFSSNTHLALASCVVWRVFTVQWDFKVRNTRCWRHC